MSTEGARGLKEGKDGWDKFAAVSPFLSGVLVACLGFYFTNVYQMQERARDAVLKEQQTRLAELGAIAQLMPWITGKDENAKTVAITAINVLASTRVAVELAKLNPGDAVREGLVRIASVATSEADRNLARRALWEIPCGRERWDIKVMNDSASGSVNLTPEVRTVSQLASIRPPARIPERERLPGVEQRTFTVRARLLAVMRERDQDYHLVIADPERLEDTMIAEIPSPDCPGAHASGRADAFRRARELVERNVTVARTIEEEPEVEGKPEVLVTGVGFFDYNHHQLGRARNGLELHPILDIKFPPQAATP